MTADGSEWLAAEFEQNRGRLRGVAHRMLGSLSEAEDAVQEAWLKLSHTNAEAIDNLSGWLTTVVARVCLDTLRKRESRREEPLEEQVPRPAAGPRTGVDPEEEALLSNSIGLALLVVLDALPPAERLAFVLHDLFATPFEEIAAILGRSSAAVRQLASRARRRVHGAPVRRDPDRARQRKVVDAFLAAARAGDFEGLLSVLDPDVVFHADAGALPPGAPREIRGAEALARRAIAGGARAAQPVLVNGSVGVVVAPLGRLAMVFRFRFAGNRILTIEAVGEPGRLRELELAILG